MVPVLSGRIQTRLFLMALVGGAVTAAFALLWTRDVFIVLAAAATVGIGWELLYHLLMQFRWEKDWPSLFGLATGVSEGVLLWLLLRVGLVPGHAGAPPAWKFTLHFGALWLAVWLVANGPMRVPFLRWRFRGGRLV